MGGVIECNNLSIQARVRRRQNSGCYSCLKIVLSLLVGDVRILFLFIPLACAKHMYIIIHNSCVYSCHARSNLRERCHCRF